MSNVEIAQQIVEALKPESGWWKSSTAETVAECAQKMLDAGMGREDVEESIDALLSAAYGEYGE